MAAEDFDRSVVVAAPRTVAWQVLTDVDRLATWVGIVHDVVEHARLEKYSAVLQDRVGPFKLRADLNIDVTVVADHGQIDVHASGRDRAVDSRLAIRASLQLSDTDGGGTQVRASGRYEVTGKVASMGGGIIRKKADVILDEFFGTAVRELSNTTGAAS